MLYIFDTSSFIVLSHYYPDQFSGFWDDLNSLVSNDRLPSVREVFNELDPQIAKPHLESWVKEHKDLFRMPDAEETEFVGKIFLVPKFLEIVKSKQLLRGTPVADPFVVAAAKIQGGCVVSEESPKPNSAKIPNVCDKFGVKCVTLQGLMEREGWQY